MSNIQKSDVKIRPSLFNPQNLAEIIKACLPEQGAIEFQHDQEGKEHSWHTHDTDETIVVIDGMLQFFGKTEKKHVKQGMSSNYLRVQNMAR